MWACGRRQTERQTDTQMHVTTIHFSWSTVTRMWTNSQLDSHHVEQFRPRQCLQTSDSLPRKTHHKSKHRVASCHTAEVISIPTFTCAILCPKGTTDLSHGWWDPQPCLVWTSQPRHRLAILFEISQFLSQYGMVGLKVSTFGAQTGKNWSFSPLKLLGGTNEHPTGPNQFQNIAHHVAKFRENRFRDIKKSVDGKKDKIIRVKYNSLPLSLFSNMQATVIK